jgi:hypothetical protein
MIVFKPVSVTVVASTLKSHAQETGNGKPAGGANLPRAHFDASNCANLCQHN